MIDKTGRELKAGQFVDIHLNGVYSAYVEEVHDSGLALPGKGSGVLPPRVVIQPLKMIIGSQDGKSIKNVYIIHEEPLNLKKDDSQPPKGSIIQ